MLDSVLENKDYVVDCKDFPEKPHIQKGWVIQSHQKHEGVLNLSDISLHSLDVFQKEDFFKIDGMYKVGGKSYKPVDATLLDFLLTHQKFFRKEWKKDKNGKTLYMYFPGTVYSGPDKSPLVRYSCWDGGAWASFYRHIICKFEPNDCVALLAID